MNLWDPCETKPSDSPLPGKGHDLVDVEHVGQVVVSHRYFMSTSRKHLLKGIFWFFVAVFLILVGLSFYTYKNPLFLVESGLLKIKEIEKVRVVMYGDSVRQTAQVRVANRLPLHMTLDSLTVRVELEGQKIGYGKRTSRLKVGALSTDTIHTIINLDPNAVLGELRDAEIKRKDSIEAFINGELYTHLPILGNLILPYTKRIDLYAIRIPRIMIKGMKLKELQWPYFNFDVNIAFTNNNPVKFGMRKIDYNLKFYEELTFQGSIPDSLLIDSFSTNSMVIPISYNLKSTPKNGLKLFHFGKGHPYELILNGELFSERKEIHSVDLELVKLGEVQLSELSIPPNFGGSNTD